MDDLAFFGEKRMNGFTQADHGNGRGPSNAGPQTLGILHASRMRPDVPSHSVSSKRRVGGQFDTASCSGLPHPRSRLMNSVRRLTAIASAWCLENPAQSLRHRRPHPRGQAHHVPSSMIY